jgi:hypothetical protein
MLLCNSAVSSAKRRARACHHSEGAAGRAERKLSQSANSPRLKAKHAQRVLASNGRGGSLTEFCTTCDESWQAMYVAVFVWHTKNTGENTKRNFSSFSQRSRFFFLVHQEKECPKITSDCHKWGPARRFGLQTALSGNPTKGRLQLRTGLTAPAAVLVGYLFHTAAPPPTTTRSNSLLSVSPAPVQHE